MHAKLGQHFLINPGVTRTAITALDLEENDFIVEIGGGHGELTFSLIAEARKHKNIEIATIEKDGGLARGIKHKIKELSLGKLVNVIESDVLCALPDLVKSMAPKKNGYKIIGNIPYYITGRIIRSVGELNPRPRLTVLTIQKEVALRISAMPPDMNLLAASVQYWAEPKILVYVSKNSFKPRPKVDSAIIKLITKKDKANFEDKIYYKLLKTIFKQPRKTILNNLLSDEQRSVTDKNTYRTAILELFSKIAIDSNARPQTLSVENIKTIGQILYNE
ncbi:ribosomal RNA small subunit methyltransferase A [Candidatus Jorgensenbacteria bacterium]|nr:ribosomal RNA small subunit methyltransferase A [Candidatus Jorgensenbacteria bacterium]